MTQLKLFAAAALAVGSMAVASSTAAQQSAGEQIVQPPDPARTGIAGSGTGTGTGGAANAAGTNAAAGAIADTGGLRDSQGVRDAVIQITIAALSDQSSLPDRLTEQDKQRIGNQFSQKNQQFDQQFSQFRQAWREKYHQDFDFASNKMAVNDASFRIVPGDVSSDNARTASSRIDVSSGASNANMPNKSKTGADDASSSKNTAGTSGSTASQQNRSGNSSSLTDANQNSGIVPPGGTSGATGGMGSGGGSNATGGGQSNMDPATSHADAKPSQSGTGTAGSTENRSPSGAVSAATPDRSDRSEIGNSVTLVIPSEQSLPTVYVPMTKSGMSDQWKLDIPDTVDASQIQTNLQKHLAAMLDQKKDWPADQNEAYRLVAHHVLAAVVNADTSGAAPQSR